MRQRYGKKAYASVLEAGDELADDLVDCREQRAEALEDAANKVW